VIFLTVGAQMPFERLVRTVDAWAGRTGRRDVFAQIGPTEYRPAHLEWTRFLEPAEFKRQYERSNVIVAHAGTGTIITALHLGKPIVVMPRRAGLRETRNDHQLATARQFSRFGSVRVAWEEEALVACLEVIDEIQGLRAVGAHASRALINSIRGFIEGTDLAPESAAPDDEENELARLG
jgi:UDP-N-acetylglucosamine transferase subunit ALG13